ncbi:methenyltetrahydromethanopterin cyclohydrolase [Acidisphaera sp. S103]|uniref:methenyltetrahydromethanopterin cyclohydrolase n=1 Tax=Acidisphaera sp. S103 TaxID=1747223 RepID=UPI00131CCEC5|nr:methenyltetrahydromethanopterin cyclohydrolase [Acidisphaera sp. S103]
MTDPTLNARAYRLVDSVRSDAAALRVGVSRGEAGELLIDAGANHQGGIAAGLRLAEICLGGLGQVQLTTDATVPHWPWTISVSTANPVTACLGSQYAGWSLSHGKGKGSFFALGSGPARVLARKEKLFEELDVQDTSKQAVLVLESGKPPPAPLVKQIAEACGIDPSGLAILYAPTQSLAGGVQVVARVLEVALHKAHELHFPLANIVDGMGAAPLPPPHPDFVTAMGRTNDAIIFGGRVHLFVTGPASAARDLAEAMPAAKSRDYGRPFAEIFKAAKGDFYAIDPMLFSPAAVTITALETGESFFAGAVDAALLDASFGRVS